MATLFKKTGSQTIQPLISLVVFFSVLLCQAFCYAQTPPVQDGYFGAARVGNGAGMIGLSAVSSAVAIYLVAAEVPGSAAPAVVVGSVSVVALVAGIAEIVAGSSQLRALERSNTRVHFSGQGLMIHFKREARYTRRAAFFCSRSIK